ncbi:MAG: hypothetical protein QOG60_2013, partial [Frankiaceae bacterium]|nr:hypothetical protein [Frankiaceae bacterium]
PPWCLLWPSKTRMSGQDRPLAATPQPTEVSKIDRDGVQRPEPTSNNTAATCA